jgi:excisionase family DNA binding protein
LTGRDKPDIINPRNTANADTQVFPAIRNAYVEGKKMKKKVFTSGEVAGICGVSADTVSRWFDLGQIEGYRLGPGGDRRIPYESLRKFMISHGIPLDRIEEGRRRILVVDDDPYYLDIIPAALSRNGEYEVATASTGFDAGALVVQDNPQLIILDIHLSDTDGRMVCKRVKDRPETRNTRILAISGYVDDEEARQLSDYGFDGYLKKPFGVAELTEEVRKLFEMPNSRIVRPKRSGTPAS